VVQVYYFQANSEVESAREQEVGLTTRDADVISEVNFPCGAVAQLGARLDGIEEVAGSNPAGSTT
jgi:hypothetical protein